MQKKVSVNEAAFSLTDPLADFTGLCCFPPPAKQPDISGRLTKIYQDGNNVSIRFMFCRTQNGLLRVLLVSLLFALLAFHTCTLPHESKAVSSHSACSATKGFASESEPPEPLGAQCWPHSSQSFLKQQQHQQGSPCSWAPSGSWLRRTSALTCSAGQGWAAHNFQEQQWKPNQLELTQTSHLLQGWISLQVTVKYAWTTEDHEIWIVSSRDWSSLLQISYLTWSDIK